MEGLRLDQVARLRGILGRGDVIAAGAEIFGNRLPQIRLVLDDDDVRLHNSLAPAFSGK